MKSFDKQNRILIAGHKGLVGSALVRVLRREGFNNLILKGRDVADLEDARAVRRLFEQEKPETVILAAAKVGGILANNSMPYDFIEHNLRIELNVLSEAHRAGVERLVFLGSSCIYPKFAEQPIREEALLTGPLEPTNRPYAIAKIAGIELCWSLNRQHGRRYFAVMPTNLYGIEDCFDLETSHVLPALMRKFHEAKQRGDAKVQVWGTGKPLREFLYSDDLAEGILFLLQSEKRAQENLFSEQHPPLINIGFGSDLSIADIAGIIQSTVGFKGRIEFDPTKPDGTPRKLMDSSRMFSIGWKPRMNLRDGIQHVYESVFSS